LRGDQFDPYWPSNHKSAQATSSAQRGFCGGRILKNDKVKSFAQATTKYNAVWRDGSDQIINSSENISNRNPAEAVPVFTRR
jgi:hypothetical protein